MSEERLYYIKSVDQWLTYAEAHSYGLTKKKPNEVTFYTNEAQPVILRKDTDTHELWDFRIEEVPHEWASSISDLGLYKKLGNVTIYQGEVPITCLGFTDSELSNELKYVYLDSVFTDLETIYYSSGITPYKCTNYIVQEGEVLAWYDAVHDPPMYWNNQSGYKRWQSTPPDPGITPVDVSDYDILNIDLRPVLEQYNLTQEQMSNVEFMRFSIEMNVEFLDEGMSASDYDMLNLPIEMQLQLYNVTQQMQLIYIRV